MTDQDSPRDQRHEMVPKCSNRCRTLKVNRPARLGRSVHRLTGCEPRAPDRRAEAHPATNSRQPRNAANPLKAENTILSRCTALLQEHRGAERNEAVEPTERAVGHQEIDPRIEVVAAAYQVPDRDLVRRRIWISISCRPIERAMPSTCSRMAGSSEGSSAATGPTPSPPTNEKPIISPSRS